MGKIKEFFRVEPHLENEKDQLYSPSKLAMKTAVQPKTNYEEVVYNDSYKGNDKKVLILGTEVGALEMKNGKKFLTGNQPVELFVPMLHWQKAGFDFDFASINGKEIKIEKWALPTEDVAVMRIYEEYRNMLEHPLKITDVLKDSDKDSKYIAVYIPGGHGAIGDIPYSKDIKKVLLWVIKEDKLLVSICHGPSALLALNLGENKKNFPFNGYHIAAFPDSNDKLLPSIGYLPGQLPYFYGSKLIDLGVTFANKLGNGKVHQDRKLITGDGPMAANELGILSAKLFLQELYDEAKESLQINS